MQKQHIAFALAVSLFLAVCSAPNAAADILLKAVGKNEISLRPKTMDSQIAIHGQIAQIQTTLTMASELDIQSEADFEYTVPDNTLVTYFAYWYKGKKVVARIVTKERAAEIYRIVSNIQNRPHRPHDDPALVEMEDKNTFHVRIFPIEANADLKVEIHSVQLLDSDAKGSLFTFPLKAPEKNRGTFEKIHLHLQLYPDSDVTSISNNYNLPLIRSNNIQTLDLQQQNWRAPQDLEVRFSRPVKALNTSLYSARAGAADGFFALTLVPSQNIPKPRLEIQGIKTWQLLPAKLAPMKAHVPVLVTGRYIGNGAAKVLLHGYGKNGILTGTAKVLFSSQIAQPNAAAQFWAKLQMQQLESNAKNKSAAIQLSQRFNLPSKYTSWLALPEEGRKIYEKNLAARSVDINSQRWATLVMQGKGETEEAKKLRADFTKKAKEDGLDPNRVIANRLYYFIMDATYVLKDEIMEQSTNQDQLKKTQRYLYMLLSYMPEENRNYVEDLLGEVKVAKFKKSLLPYVDLVEEGKQNSKRAQILHQRLTYKAEKLKKEDQSHSYNLQSAINDLVGERINKLSKQWVSGVMKNGRNQQTRQIHTKIQRLQKIADSYYSRQFESRKGYELHHQLFALISQAKKDKNIDYKKTVQDLRDKSKTVASDLHISEKDRTNYFVSSVQRLIEPIAKKYFSIKDEPATDQTQSELLRAQLNNVANELGISFDNLVYHYAFQWAVRNRYGLPSVIAREKLKDNPDTEKIRTLESRLQKSIQVLEYVPEKYREILEYRPPSYYNRVKTVKEYVGESIRAIVSDQISNKEHLLSADKSLKHRDVKYDEELEKEVKTLTDKYLEGYPLKSYYFWHNKLYSISSLLYREYRKENPDEDRLKELKHTLIESEKEDGYLTSRFTSARKITNPTLYGNLRAQRLELRANREKLEDKIKSESDPAQLKSLNDQRAEIMAQQKKLIARMGDPLISVQAPDAASVVALMPDGQIKQLVFDVQKNRWEARFDIPASAVEGEYAIQIIVVRKDGSRQMLQMHYSVDLTPPAGNAQMKVIDKNYSGQKVLRLEVQTDENAARVSALLPWNAKVELMPSENTSNQFFALTPLPDGYGKSTFPVTFVLTDKAHNRAEITVSNK